MANKHLHAFVCTLIALLGGVILPMPISAQTVDSDVTATWPFDLGTEGQTATITPEDGGEWFKNSYVEIGSGLIIPEGKETEAVDGLTLTKLRPTVKATTPDDNATVKFMISPKNGLKFKPTEISFRAARFGTDDCLIDISWIKADGSVTKLQTGIKPGRPKNSKGEPEYTDVLINDLAAIEAPEGLCGLQIHIYSLGNTKEAGFANVIIKGHIEGTPVEIKQCTLTVQTSPEGAGTISVQPVGSVFDENTELTLTQTRNFGYKFTGWSVGGETVSTDDTYTFNITEDATVTANYDKINTYSLTYGATGGGKDYMVTPVPAPTVVDGKNMYEEGQEVTLTATGNYILDFANWSSGETTPELKLAMDADKAVSAAFSTKLDCIAGWDFYTAAGNGRTADFYSEGNDATALTLRNEEGVADGWLDKSYEKDPNGYEGRQGVVNWRTDGLGKYYWQTMINASAFKDIKVRAEMLFNYNAYTKQDVEYSLNGTDWTLVGSYNLTEHKQWTEEEFTLPAEANNKEAVYIRWKSDTSSDTDGTPSSNDGIAIAGIFITGTQEYIDDGVAPKLVSTVPAEGATNASANGRIVLNFDEKVKVKEGTKATLGSQELEPQVSGKSIMFEYKGLDYSTPYTFTLPANTVRDMTDNFITNDITVSFTTMTRPVVAKDMFDFIVPDDGTITQAIAAAAEREDTNKRFYIFVKQGDIVIPASETATVDGKDGEKYPSPITKLDVPNVSIIGEGMDITSIANTVPDKTIPNPETNNHEPINPVEGLGTSTNIQLGSNATNIYVQDITLKNSIDDGLGRNVALEDGGDRNIFKNVRLYGYQDTYYSKNGRYYFEGGELRGRVDFLCGGGDVFYNGVTLAVCGDGYIVAPGKPKQYGYIFRDCTIKGDNYNGTYKLGRPWGDGGEPIALYINTTMEIQPTAEGWNEMGDGWPARFAEYGSKTAAGTPINLSSRKKIFAGTHENNPILTKEEADFYTIENVLGGDDDWNPTSLTEQASAPTNVEIDGSTLTWDDSQYVLCWAVCKDGKVIDFTTEPTYTVDDAGAKYSVRAANQMGGLGEAAEAQVATGIDEVGTTENGEAVSTTYYSIDGTRVNSDYRGVVIKVKTMADGSKTTHKTIRK